MANSKAGRLTTATTTATKATKAMTKITTVSLQTKIDTILPKDNICYGWLSKALTNMLQCNAHMICDYVIAMRQ